MHRFAPYPPYPPSKRRPMAEKTGLTLVGSGKPEDSGSMSSIGSLMKRIALLPHELKAQIICETLCEERCIFTLLPKPHCWLCSDGKSAAITPHIEVYTKGHLGKRGTITIGKDHNHFSVNVIPHDFDLRPCNNLLRRSFPAAYLHGLQDAGRRAVHAFRFRVRYDSVSSEEQLSEWLRKFKATWTDEGLVKHPPPKAGSGNTSKNNRDAHTATAMSVDGSEGGPDFNRFRHLLLANKVYDRDPDFESIWELCRRRSKISFPYHRFLWCPSEYREHMTHEHRAVVLQPDWAILSRNLETLTLDLRRKQALTNIAVFEAAKVMSANLQLRRLLLMGLRTEKRQKLVRKTLKGTPANETMFASSEHQTIEDLEEVESFGKFKNWVAAFRGALRPGGELVFVDILA
ncbi:predicted protein [Verticillium alfalfae VaMs.102]|uniref:Predicted protein n=1 Tax=Verticillium alfalfae (strain VaMs.102 / ATCC MYA-4576 / FGSC 10136) TaxID=526221 RepID=C9SMP3_VERA1|nr:predicted protein [Verticillium alfalfae VaMs.102]EEY20058.1 predicted protein [Verticillium alfalfae VaMs.102]